VIVGLFRLFIRSLLTRGRMISAHVLRDLAARFQTQTVLALQDRQRNLWLLDPAQKMTVGRSTKCTVVVKENAANVSRSSLQNAPTPCFPHPLSSLGEVAACFEGDSVPRRAVCVCVCVCDVCVCVRARGGGGGG
jgi:hypothetical protein